MDSAVMFGILILVGAAINIMCMLAARAK